MPLFCILMFMKGQTAAATQAAEGEPLGERGSLPALGGLLTSPAVPPEQRSNDSGGCFPPEIFTQKGMEDNWIYVYNLCILLGFPNFGNAMMTLVYPWRNGEMLPQEVMAPWPRGSPFWYQAPEGRKGGRTGDNVYALSEVMYDADKSKCIWQIWNNKKSQYLY